jgi:hypothetical protein
MTTLVLSETTETTTIGELLRNAADPVIEIRSEDGDLMATVTLATADGFDYTPYLSDAERFVDEYLRKPPVDSSKCLTTRELLDSLHALETGEQEEGLG